MKRATARLPSLPEKPKPIACQSRYLVFLLVMEEVNMEGFERPSSMNSMGMKLRLYETGALCRS